MKRDLQKVKILRDHVLGLRMELDLIVNDLRIINIDLEYLENIEEELVYNIKILKREKVVAIISQYKKSLLELESVKKNITHYRNNKAILEQKYEIKTKNYKKTHEDYEIRRKAMENSKVILLFNRNKRNKE